MGVVYSAVSAETVSNEANQLVLHRSLGKGVGSAQDSTSDNRDVVVLTVDDSPEASYAVDWYLKYMHQPANKLYVLHCWEVERPLGHHFPDYAIAPEAWSEVLEKSKSHGSEILKKYEEKLKQHKVNATLRSVFGRPGHTIVESANEYHANQIVIGSRSLGPLGRTLLGSISNYVVHHSSVPVTIVPRPTSGTPGMTHNAANVAL